MDINSVNFYSDIDIPKTSTASLETENLKKSLEKYSFSDVLKKTGGEQGPEEKKETLKKLCQDMESIFMYQMIKVMRKSVPESEFVEKGPGEKIFKEMLDEKYAQKMASASTTGLADMLYRSLETYI